MKRLKIIGLVCLLTLINFNVVQADIGPKPAIYLTFENIDQAYYVSIFSKGDDTFGPNGAVDKEEYVDNNLPDEVRDFFFDYKDMDNYKFWGWWDEISPDHKEVSWTYYAPVYFKVVVYDLKNNESYVSDQIYRSTLTSYYRCSLKNHKVYLQDNHNFIGSLDKMLFRAIATIIIELAVGLFFGMWKKDRIKIIVWANVFTQLFLNVILSIFIYFTGPLATVFVMIPLEVIVTIIEAVIYYKKLDSKTWVSILYSLVANMTSRYIGAFLLVYEFY